ncbi:MAG: hypothetical protein PHV34_07350 [Verrucomicrobiae bacterium]|nr:hypothetical protein [Verrucomicrobiae bacterium]
MNADDMWYAVANTEVVVPPRQRLDTFGATVITYHLLAEKMDAVNEVRIREGRIHAERPQVLTPAYFERLMLEGFGNEAQQYIEWLQAAIPDLTFLKYGFGFRKENLQESTIHETLATATERVKRHVEEKNEPLTTVIKGVDDAWEICLLKFMSDTIHQTVPQHVKDLRRRKLLENIEGIPRFVREEIERDFAQTGKDPEKIKALGAKLCHYGVFENYEDRFYEIMKES